MALIDVCTSVFAEDVLDKISDETLWEEVVNRGLVAKFGDALTPEDVHAMLLRGDVQGAIIELGRVMFPPDRSRAKAAYARALENRDPETGRPVVEL